MKGNFSSRLFTGLIIITVGIVFLLRELGMIDISIGSLFATYWPCILIALGLQQLLSGRSSGDSGGWWGGVMIFIGVVFLGNNLDWPWSIGDLIPYLIPVAIIIVGMRIILRPGSKRQSPPEHEWKSYRNPYEGRDNVPPAPPLHPDPTGVTGDLGEENKAGANHSGGEKPRQNYHEFEGHYEKDRRRKRRKRKSQDYDDEYDYDDDDDYVEWWGGDDSKVQNRSGFIGDIHMGHDHWELKPLNISHFIGDTVLDLTRAQIPYGETKVTISSFIGDVKVYLPNDYEVGIQVVSNAFLGDVKVLGRREGGIFTSTNIKSPRYEEAPKKIKLVVSTFLGDSRVTKVG
ncbi:cell wall-active antibiotics response protein LiaF [Paenibacillus sp. J5C_2022]|uniref:cell wall-active antibiotics response protein LiaF n=1 Tax=Paenibacillus sp. J5C2022 TaxID=2977129 RepID=UPI0021CE884A|nr:cell wall-active antibiotics response protein LiaF [Paenibacillus sp. J5C2022]MCU6709866.1 cell wall-active antibiotics response protein LiaF [Paenibacillus sp. J5C2022]